MTNLVACWRSKTGGMGDGLAGTGDHGGGATTADAAAGRPLASDDGVGAAKPCQPGQPAVNTERIRGVSASTADLSPVSRQPHQIAGQARHPLPYAQRSVEVSAMPWDGSEVQAEAIVAWVKASGTGSAAYGIDGIFVEQYPARPVRVQAGTVLVRGTGGWQACPADRFTAEFRRVVRELPIFDDGEVA